ncbi:hypothetical protein ACIGXI_05620 [Kitasatospora aureofaciens]|uniref:hypothetical protein n=1 Tax=Kitasatospora aureofaciens TaxID=1894 RepID=UPI0037C8FA80
MALVSTTRITHTTGAAAEPLLSFELTTNPDPLKASPENPSMPEEKGELIIVGSRHHREAADVEWIRVKVPAGTMSPDLAANLTSVTARISLDGWTPHLDESSDEFVFTPAADHGTIGPDTGFTIQLSQIPINRKVGTSPITVTEHSRTGNSAFQKRSTTFGVGKFPADFYLRNLVATPLVIDNSCDPDPNDPEKDCREVTLTWERSTNATYELLYGNTSLNVTNGTTRKVPNVTSDTTFYLRGTAGTDSTNPVVRTLSAHVSVLKPDLEVRNLTVRGTTELIGTTQANGLTVNTGHALTAHGPITANGTLTANGPITTNDTLTAKGPIDTDDTLTANGLIVAKQPLGISSEFIVEVGGKAIFKGGASLFDTYAVENLTLLVGRDGSWRSPAEWSDGMVIVHNAATLALTANVSTGAGGYTIYLQPGERVTFPLARRHTLTLRRDAGDGAECTVIMIPLGGSMG